MDPIDEEHIEDPPAPGSERGEYMLTFSDKVECRFKNDDGGATGGRGFTMTWVRSVRWTSSATLSIEERDIISASSSIVRGSGSDSASS